MKTSFIFWVFYIIITRSSTQENNKKHIVSLLNIENNDTKTKSIVMRHFAQQSDDETKDIEIDNDDYSLLKFRSEEDRKKKNVSSRSIYEAHVATEHPWLQRRFQNKLPYRRQYKYKDEGTDSDTDRESSTSSEMKHWKEEFDIEWANKKMEAIKEKTNTSGAINIKMASGRPWGIPCGDPNQHDVPWGTCVLPYECDGEFRIYRGDERCGRTNFVCCSLQVTHHDLYQALDMSFVDTSVSTDSAEKRKKKKGSKENKKRKKLREILRRRRNRFRMKRTIKKYIRKLARQIRKALNRAFRNATGDRRQKTKQLKIEIKNMKKKFYMDRKLAKNVHDYDIQKVDSELKYKLTHIKELNQNFLMNDTYREIILNNNGTALRMLLEAYPELEAYMPSDVGPAGNFSMPSRRSGSRVIKKKKKRKIRDYLEYDIEYGVLYY